MPYCVGKFCIRGCESGVLGTSLATLVSHIQAFSSPMIRAHDCYGSSLCFPCTLNRVALHPYSPSRETLEFEVGCFEDLEKILQLIEKNPNAEFEIGERGGYDGYLFSCGANFQYVDAGNSDFTCSAGLGSLKAIWPQDQYRTTLPPPAPNGTPPVPMVTVGFFNSQWDCPKPKPDPWRCQHEPVNMSFNFIRMVCKKCETELPDDYGQKKVTTDED